MSLLSRILGERSAGDASETPETVTYEVIGVVRNAVTRMQSEGWQYLESEIELRPGLVTAVDALEGYSHVIVVFHLDRVPESERRLRVQVGNEARPPERGVLATRSQRRPNPIGVSVVQLLDCAGTTLRVRGLDALDGTPVLDVKPYLPAHDAAPDATLPPWAVKSE